MYKKQKSPPVEPPSAGTDVSVATNSGNYTARLSKTENGMHVAKTAVPAGNTPNRELRKLDMFIGKWKLNGKNLAGAPVGRGEPIIGEETYEWLPGRFFCVGKWYRQSNNADHKGISLVGFNESTGHFLANHFDNLGFAREYTVEHDQLTWRYVGEKERALIEFNPDGESFVAHWEIAGESGKWLPLCYLEATKVH